uniref:Uncharacterized protein n=1 Tax=Rhizophora mucronata TaxID=61149 RepID=A0A2P2NV37_RHIMU
MRAIYKLQDTRFVCIFFFLQKYHL